MENFELDLAKKLHDIASDIETAFAEFITFIEDGKIDIVDRESKEVLYRVEADTTYNTYNAKTGVCLGRSFDQLAFVGHIVLDRAEKEIYGRRLQTVKF